MAASLDPAPVRLERLPPHAWVVIAVLILSFLYAIVDVTRVRPYLWPAGAGATVSADPASRWPLVARPPDLRGEGGEAARVTSVAAGSPAAAHGLAAGAIVTAIV